MITLTDRIERLAAERWLKIVKDCPDAKPISAHSTGLLVHIQKGRGPIICTDAEDLPKGYDYEEDWIAACRAQLSAYDIQLNRLRDEAICCRRLLG